MGNWKVSDFKTGTDITSPQKVQLYENIVKRSFGIWECAAIKFKLGGVNNLEPVINSETNKITIIDQTSIPGKDEIAKLLNLYSIPQSKPILEVFGYNDDKSNFVKSIGLKTEITKEYATMLTIGAT